MSLCGCLVLSLSLSLLSCLISLSLVVVVVVVVWTWFSSSLLGAAAAGGMYVAYLTSLFCTFYAVSLLLVTSIHLPCLLFFSLSTFLLLGIALLYMVILGMT